MPNPVIITFKDGFDWKMLAQQKLELLQLIPTPNSVLHGLVNLIDELQDAGVDAGYPVVFLEDDNE